jgi:mRNA (guanine-N7-)-methyltransferase
MISVSMIVGNEPEIKKEIKSEDNVLETDDIYYERNVPFNKISNSMLLFHMLVKSQLYNKPPLVGKPGSKFQSRGALLELACGQAGDLTNWKYSKYQFVLGIDLVKSNIYTSKGSYAKLIREHKKQLNYNKKTGRNFSLIDMAFVVGDCTLDIKNGEAAIDKESKDLLKIIMNPVKKQQNLNIYERVLAGKGKDKFNVISCMFAIHYFFESETKLEQFLSNVSDNLQQDGLFFATFMDGSSVEAKLKTKKNGIIEGRKNFDEYSVPVWAIIKQYTNEKYYNKKIDVFIENTQKLIREYLVNFEFLVTKAKEYGLELEETELFSETYEKIKKDFEKPELIKNKFNLFEAWRIEDHKNSLKELETNEISKGFSFLNRWVIFKKV